MPAGTQRCTCPPPSVEAHPIRCPNCGGALAVGARACPFCRSTLATTRCSSCFAWNLAGADFCQACGRKLDASAGDAAPTHLACPRCGGRLVARRYHELDADECDQCGGFLLSAANVDRLIASRDVVSGLRLALPAHPHTLEKRVRYISCPVCNNTMNREAFGHISGVVVDVCRNDGVWFDPGELAEVSAFIEKGGLERARARQVAQLDEAARRMRTERAMEGVAAQVDMPRAIAGPAGFGADFVQALASLWN